MVGGKYTYAEVPLGFRFRFRVRVRDALHLRITLALIGSIVSRLTLSRVHDRRLAELPRPAATS